MSKELVKSLKSTLLLFAYFLGFGSLINLGVIVLAAKPCPIDHGVFEHIFLSLFGSHNIWLSFIAIGIAGMILGIRSILK